MAGYLLRKRARFQSLLGKIYWSVSIIQIRSSEKETILKIEKALNIDKLK